jgi:UDP-N-acetylmuramoylalanine--D-glutamate ligase
VTASAAARASGPERYLVIGFGVTGQAVAAWARSEGAAVVVAEDRPGPEAPALAERLGVRLAGRPDRAALAALVEQADVVVPSPGVPLGHDVYALAARAGRPVRSEIELAYRALRARPEPRPALAAITGTNGKTTVTTLVTEMLLASGRRALAAGNIGRPLIEAVGTGTDVVVAEVSSFQLQFTEQFRPRVSCWLNLTPDHLDWHPDLAHYAAAKARVWANQGPGDTAVFNADDPLVAAAAAALPAGVAAVSFGTRTATGTDAEDGRAGFRVVDGALWAHGAGALVEASQLPRALPHDLANSLAAAAVGLACGATTAGIRQALVHTPALPHRVELVAEAAGLRWYDDSKATTPASVLAAVAGFSSAVLIAGGRNKGLDLTVLGQAVPPVRAAVAIGEAAEEVAAALGTRVPVRRATSMEEAVEAAAALAREGDAVILSPGCASFDWYGSYAARGEHFAALVRERIARQRLEKGVL